MGREAQKEWNLVLIACLLGVPLLLLGLLAASAMKLTFLTQGKLNRIISEYNKQPSKPLEEQRLNEPADQICWALNGTTIKRAKLENALAYGLIYGGSHKVTLSTDDGRTVHGYINSRFKDFDVFGVERIEGKIDQKIITRAEEECIEEVIRLVKQRPDCRSVSFYSWNSQDFGEERFLEKLRVSLQKRNVKLLRQDQFSGADTLDLDCHWQRSRGDVVVECR